MGLDPKGIGSNDLRPMRFAERLPQPCPRKLPIFCDGALGHAKRLSDLNHGQTGQVFHRNHLVLPRIQIGECAECSIEPLYIDIGIRHRTFAICQRDTRLAAKSLLCISSPRVVDQNSLHRDSRRSKNGGPACRVQIVARRQSHPAFIRKRGWLERVVNSLVLEK